MKTYSTTQILRLIDSAKAWAAFQEGDSLIDQAHDEKLKSEAIDARERLLNVINDLG